MSRAAANSTAATARAMQQQGITVPLICVPPIVVDRETAAALLSLGLSSFQAAVATGLVPKPRRLSSGRVGWLYSELLECAQGLPVSDMPPPPNTANRRGKKAANDDEGPEK